MSAAQRSQSNVKV